MELGTVWIIQSSQMCNYYTTFNHMVILYNPLQSIVADILQKYKLLASPHTVSRNQYFCF